MMEPTQLNRFTREIVAIGNHVDDPEAFAAAVAMIGVLNDTASRAAVKLYGEGYSYADLAKPLGISRQAVAKRWPQIFRVWRG